MYEAFPDADGLHYESPMHPNSAAMALWERAATALPVAPRLNRPLGDPDLWHATYNAARNLGYRVR